YTAFPFMLENEKGFIIADPTSNQLWRDQDIAPRNHIFVAGHKNWEYRTNWKDGSDLYPDTYINLDSFRSNIHSWTSYNGDIETYFKKTFENPVIIHSRDDMEVL
ncbi:MAG: hypothetical protein OEL87_00760, partial [Nanoarchaeota archaeon]|nr:hypothetical protein [Nanoarchaeota archaeon]